MREKPKYMYNLSTPLMERAINGFQPKFITPTIFALVFCAVCIRVSKFLQFACKVLLNYDAN